jgi:hypothetical protein
LGSNTITAQFTGDSSYSPSPVSNSQIISNTAGTFITLTSSNPTIQHGASVTFTAVIKTTIPITGAPAITGTVQFKQNSAAFGTPVTVSNGQAQITTSTLPGGSLNIEADYSGDANYAATVGFVFQSVQLLATTTTVTTSNPAIVQGTSVTLTAHVAPNAAGGPALTGTVQFLSSFSPQSGDNLVGTPVTVTNGQAQLTTSSISAGQTLILAAYSGDANYENSTGSTAEVVTPPPTFTVVGNPTSITISSPGGSGSAMLTFTALNAYSGTIPLSPALCSGMPSETTCSFSAPSVALSATTTTATATVTFQTTARSTSTALPQATKHPAASERRMPAGSFVLAFVLCLAILFACFAPRQRRLSTILALLAIASAVAIGSCGGGSGSTSTGPPGGGNVNPGTPVGVDQSVSITFSGAGVTPPPTVNFSITVQ